MWYQRYCDYLEKRNYNCIIPCPAVEFDNFQGSKYDKMVFFQNVPRILKEHRNTFKVLSRASKKKLFAKIVNGLILIWVGGFLQTSNDIDMKLGPLFKLEKRNTLKPKRFDDDIIGKL